MMTDTVGYPTKSARGAQRIAHKGKPIFPCREDKSPLTPRGFKDATTNPGLVKGFWTKYPDALIGMPTGSHSGVFVVDLDRLEALGELERELPETLTVRTRSGGRHYYFQHVDGIRNSPGGLPEGIDVRGEGGYVIAPPSPGYTVEVKAEIAPAPEWLLELIRKKPERPDPNNSATGHSSINLATLGPIPTGGRNNTLARIAGKLRARGFEHADLEAVLLEINAERCTPPLDEGEVRRIAASYARYEKGKAGADRQTLDYLDELEREVWAAPWPKIGGKSERSLVVVAMKEGRKHGRQVPDGVEVEIAHSQLALAAATSKRTVMRVLSRSEWLRRGKSARDGKSGSVILINPRARCHHSTSRLSLEDKPGMGGDSLRAPFSCPRLRWSAPGVLRLGKSAEAVVDHLERTGGEATVEELAEFMHVSRMRDFRRRVIGRLEERGIVTVSEAGETVSLVEDWLDAINEERDRSGEIDKLRRDTVKFNLQSKAYRKRRKNRPDENPPMRKRQERPASEEIGEVSLLAAVLHDYLYHHTPADADQRPEWLANVLWADGRYPGKPTHLDVSAALEELGGDRFRLDCLARARAEAARMWFVA
jgi:hypothetical protein